MFDIKILKLAGAKLICLKLRLLGVCSQTPNHGEDVLICNTLHQHDSSRPAAKAFECTILTLKLPDCYLNLMLRCCPAYRQNHSGSFQLAISTAIAISAS